MKKYYSVFSLYIRKDFWKCMILLLALFAADTVIYFRYAANLQTEDFQHVMVNSRQPFERIFLVAFLALCVIRSFQGKSRSSYGCTLSRLRISERAVFGMNALANACYFIVLWLAHAFMVYFSLRRFAAAAGQEDSYTWLITLLCSDGFFHGLIPVADPLTLIRNILYAAAAGIACAALTLSARHHERLMSPVILILTIIGSFSIISSFSTGYWSVLWIILPGIFGIFSLFFTIAFSLDKAHDGRRAHED